MFPVYRVSEGVENLEENYKTFDECIEVFKKNGIVLIFSEGKCINEWHLRSLKKGTARLAITAWERGIPLKVIPLGINYQSFKSFGKNIFVNVGKFITRENILFNNEDAYGAKEQTFNAALKLQLQELVFEINAKDTPRLQETFSQKVSILKKVLLFIPAIIGFIFHAPLYLPIKQFAYNKFGKIDHYDSVVVGLLFTLYPIYLVLLTIIGSYFFGLWSLLILLSLPLCAWSFVQIKKQF